MGFIPFVLFGSEILFAIFSLALLIVYFIAESNEKNFGIILATIFFICFTYFGGNIEEIINYVTWKHVGLYFTVGFAFAIIRTFFKGRELSDDDKKHYNLKASVFRWWFLFPISLLTWLCGHLMRDFYSWLYDKIGKMFITIFNYEKRPPIGLIPKKFSKSSNRLQEVSAAIKRYADAKIDVPQSWYDELYDLQVPIIL